jgi:hypothetical protein
VLAVTRVVNRASNELFARAGLARNEDGCVRLCDRAYLREHLEQGATAPGDVVEGVHLRRERQAFAAGMSFCDAFVFLGR